MPLNSIIYLQCDARYNQWMMRKINDRNVIDYTIEKCKSIGCKKIIAGIYDCTENHKLVTCLEQNEIEIVLSKEKDVNKRFMKIVTGYNEKYVVRVGGDACLLDSKQTMTILDNMEKQDKDWFYEEYINSILPDIIKIQYLKENIEQVQEEKRYMDWMIKEKKYKRYKLDYLPLCSYEFRTNSRTNFEVCKKIIEENLDIYELSRELQLKLIKSAYLNKTGLMGSWILANTDHFFIDDNGHNNPWWGRTIIDFITPFLNKDMSVFEWGSGNSTLYWCEHMNTVTTIEYDKEWFQKMSQLISDNVNLKYFPLVYGGDYSKAISEEDNLYDIILIDGRDRVRCAHNCVDYLKTNGIIIWDNSERDGYKEGYEFLIKHGFKRIEFSSIIYGLPGIVDYTSIFYRADNFLNL